VANGVQLATAYISLNVRTDDIKKQVNSALSGVGREGRQVGTRIGSNIGQGIRNSMGGARLSMSIFNPMEIAGVRWAMKAGAAIGSALKKALIGAASLTGAGSIFAVGGLLSAGLDRLKTLQRAEVQLSLKLDPAEIKRVRAAVEEAVKGTPISLDAAMRAAPRLVNAGLSAEQIKQYTETVANLSAATGGVADFERLDLILGQIRSKGKLTGEEMMQLIEAGVDVRGMLKETFGWDDKTLEKNLKNNKVAIDQILKAADTVYPGLAQKFGETFDGAMGNLKASAARLGANILGVLFSDEKGEDPLKGAVDGVTSLTEKLDTAGKWVAENKDEIRQYFSDAKTAATDLANGIKGVVQWLKETWRTGEELGTKIGRGFESAKTTVNSWWTSASDKLGRMKTKIGDIFEDLKKKFDGIFGADGWIAQQFNKIGDLIGKVRDTLGLGEATANASAPGAAPFNAGPMRPGASAPTGGREPGWGGPSGMVPGASGSNSGSVASGWFGGRGDMGQKSGLSVRMPTQSVIGTPLYSGPVTEDTGGSIEPRNALVQDLINQQFGRDGATIGNDYRKPDGFNEHSSGQAADIMVSELGQRTEEGIALGNRINKWLLDNAEKIGLQYTIWDGMLYRPDGSVSPNGGSGPTLNHEDHVHYRVNPGAIEELPKFGVGGRVSGAGHGTSDSIPAMLSNGEHVLTADDVKRMGGQNGVYAFRQALQAGLIPGFAPGGAVDPSVEQDAQNNINDLVNDLAVNKARFDEIMANEDATDGDKDAARRALERSNRMLQQARADLPILLGGGTPPDRSNQNRLFDVTDQLAAQNNALIALQGQDDVPDSQMIQAQYGVASLQREREQLISQMQGGQQGQGTDYGAEFVRSLGFIPASAGNTGVAGTSSLAGFIGMGNDIVGGLIDTGTNLAQTAVSAAIAAGAAAGSFGAAAPAAPAAQMAASYGIQLLGNQAKRVSSYWFQMAGIGADALMEQLSPFGMPRWLGYDYGNFAPQLGIQQAALSTIEQMGTDAINKQFSGQNGPPTIPADPTAGVNMTPSGPSAGTASGTVPGGIAPPQTVQIGPPSGIDPNNTIVLDPFGITNPLGAGGAGGGGSWAKGGAVGIYDNGGVLNPGELAFNASRTPESILTKQQWQAMEQTASTGARGSGPLVENLYAQDMQDAIRQLEKVKRRDMMQYAGRP